MPPLSMRFHASFCSGGSKEATTKLLHLINLVKIAISGVVPYKKLFKLSPLINSNLKMPVLLDGQIRLLYDRNKQIPPNSLDAYCEMLWKSILAILATFRFLSLPMNYSGSGNKWQGLYNPLEGNIYLVDTANWVGICYLPPSRRTLKIC